MSVDPMSWALLRIEELESRCKHLELYVKQLEQKLSDYSLNRLAKLDEELGLND